MPDRPARKQPQQHRATVLHKEQLSPHMVRVVLGGDGLSAFAAGEFTDHYVKLVFPRPEVTYPQPFDLAQARAELPRHEWPLTRTYTVRSWDPRLRELAIDFVVHGDEGIAGPWAEAARPGDELVLAGPGGAYRPSPEADWHLLAGDESALPAIAASLEEMPEGARATVLVEVAGPEEEQKLAVPEGAEVVWLHRNGARVGSLLTRAVRELDWPQGDLQAFVHGEAGFVKELRRYLRVERQVPRERLSVSGYWRLGSDEDGWQAAKREWNAQVEAEQESGGTVSAPAGR
ncbi:siderophore-interacting protein [Streptomyces xiaopingdaonensis]|uniref:siderophore-interacting protein n=1 Tax=Streptomyces xiaopingdaonensis TaxID=1565415 RepID=UPI0002DB3F32|nr:siderophore-interacting protein [Streptomyces xiaopingdaonensis]